MDKKKAIALGVFWLLMACCVIWAAAQ